MKGNIYFALKGANFNGNKFAEKAFDKGAAYVVLDEHQDALDGDKRVLYVDDVQNALRQLARYHRKRLKAKIIALTGSNGKTTTKELLYNILKNFYSETYATQGNLNNHIGVPLTLLNLPLSAEYAIIEMGSNQAGDIKMLCDIVNPNYGLITNIGKTHLENLLSIEGVFEEKSALFKSINDARGVFFKNENDPFISRLEPLKTVTYSVKKTLGYSISKINNGPCLAIDLKRDNQNIRINTQLFGDYNLENISAAITVAEYFSVPILSIKEAIEDYHPENMRSQVLKTDKNQIIIDAYNSNPESLDQALKEFVKINARHKFAFIGDMLELGASSKAEHQNIVEYLSAQPLIETIYIGREFQKVTDYKQLTFRDVDECISSIEKRTFVDSTILLKGSRALGLEKLLPFL